MITRERHWALREADSLMAEMARGEQNIFCSFVEELSCVMLIQVIACFENHPSHT